MTDTPSPFSVDDESAVRMLVSEFANTWNRHDMKTMHELDTEDVEWCEPGLVLWLRGLKLVKTKHVESEAIEARG